MASGAIGRLAVGFAVATGRHWQRPFAPSLCTGVLTFSTLAEDAGRKRIVFFGTPQVAALVLQDLLQAAAAPDSNFEVAAVVSRPSSRQWIERERLTAEAGAASETAASLPAAGGGPPSEGVSARTQHTPRERRQLPNWARHGASAVEKLAHSSGVPAERILCPISAKEPDFLEAMRQLRPHLAITAAYGGMLPQTFLDIPKYGTLNIHPSLLPRYRGPAPVARALQDGCSVSGVSLVFTVLQCDAGPVLAQEQITIDPDIQAPELTEQLFRRGSRMLLRHLPGLLSGQVTTRDAVLQDEAAASYAPKVGKQDGALDFWLSARRCHDHVRAMAGWPGAKASLLVENRAAGTLEPIEVKVLRSRVVGPRPAPDFMAQQAAAGSAAGAAGSGPGSAGGATSPSPAPASLQPPRSGAQLLYTAAGELLVPCGDGNLLSILEVARRRAGNSGGSLSAKDFMNGLGKRRLFIPERM